VSLDGDHVEIRRSNDGPGVTNLCCGKLGLSEIDVRRHWCRDVVTHDDTPRVGSLGHGWDFPDVGMRVEQVSSQRTLLCWRRYPDDRCDRVDIHDLMHQDVDVARKSDQVGVRGCRVPGEDDLLPSGLNGESVGVGVA